MNRPSLILGGAKSGKSSLALRLAQAQPGEKIFLATAQALDGEMNQRIARHQAERGPQWRTVEEPLELTAALAREDGPGRVILVDCLTLWTSNLMTLASLEDEAIFRRGRELAQALPGLQAQVILVANEVGLGIVPGDPLSRRFRDLAGGLNQTLAKTCPLVVFTAAGLPLALKGRLPDNL